MSHKPSESVATEPSLHFASFDYMNNKKGEHAPPLRNLLFYVRRPIGINTIHDADAHVLDRLVF